jgi:hypothetical protein
MSIDEKNSEIDVFINDVSVDLKGQTYKIAPLPWTTEIRLSKVIAPLVAAGLDFMGKKSLNVKEFFLFVLDADVEKSIETITEALEMATGIPKETLQSLHLGELEQLCLAVVAVNKTFFLKFWERLSPQKAKPAETGGNESQPRRAK